MSKKVILSQKVKDNIFYYSFFIVPLLVFTFGFVFINGNSILLAFKGYNNDATQSYWVGFKNFGDVIQGFISNPSIGTALRNSIKAYVVSTAVSMTIPVFFAYYIYKKLPGSSVFKVILFLPSIISSIISAVIFKYIGDRVLPDLMLRLFDIKMTGLFSDPGKIFNSMLFYCTWMGLGGGLLVQLGAMNAVDKSVVEAGLIDGIGFWGEFWHIVLPKTYQILTIGLILGFNTIFTSDIEIYAFYGLDASEEVKTLGYFFNEQTLKGTLVDYPFLAAWGLLITVLSVPVTFFLRHIIYKYGPQE